MVTKSCPDIIEPIFVFFVPTPPPPPGEASAAGTRWLAPIFTSLYRQDTQFAFWKLFFHDFKPDEIRFRERYIPLCCVDNYEMSLNSICMLKCQMYNVIDFSNEIKVVTLWIRHCHPARSGSLGQQSFEACDLLHQFTEELEQNSKSLVGKFESSTGWNFSIAFARAHPSKTTTTSILQIWTFES